VGLTAIIGGRTSASLWDFGDGTGSTNEPYTSHAWVAPGDYPVELYAYDENQSAGISATITIHVVPQPVHYVAAASSSPTAPYISWATAARTIQDAVDAATVPGSLVLATNGIYATGGRAVPGQMLPNRVAADKPLVLRSVNGPQFTMIQGYQVPGTTNGFGAIRCVYLSAGAGLSGFTLSKGATLDYSFSHDESGGGGVWCELGNAVISNCVLVGNSGAWGGGAFGGTLNNCTLSANSAGEGGGANGSTLYTCTLTDNSAGSGGGAYEVRLNNCTLSGNSAGSGGGGASESVLNNCRLVGNTANGEYGGGGGVLGSTLNNCTLYGNSASQGGGASSGTMNNCIAYFNTGAQGANYEGTVLNYCCATPQPSQTAGGVGNISNAPLFVDSASGNLRLQPDSPCINAGNNAYSPAGPDLDGNPRNIGGTVDIGAYESQTSSSLISYARLQQHGLPTDGSADYADPDHDGMNNWQEWIAGTDPANPSSVLRMLAPARVTNGLGVNLTWQSVSGISYFIERSTNLGNQPAFSLLQTNIVGQAGTTTYTETNALGAASFFYRVGVEN
jgi:hypothetical protein